MLSEKKVEQNGDIFLQKCEEFNIFNPEFLDKYAGKILLAPASLNQYASYNGGLVKFILKMTANVININKGLKDIFDEEYLIKLCFRQSIGKALMYVDETEEWKINKGFNYKYENLNHPFTVNELSIQMMTECGIKLSKQEFSDIMSFSKEHDKAIEIFASNEYNLVNFAYKLTAKQLKK